MQSLLRWSIENSSASDDTVSQEPTSTRKGLDPGIIDMILGKPDAELMKEDMAVALDASRSEDDRINALDHFEMLIEHIDNANNIEKLKLWEPLLSLLTSEQSTPEIKIQALWIIGTAAQNNPPAQDVCLSYNPLHTVFSFLNPSTSPALSLRSKAVYAISGLLKHNAPAVEALDNSDTKGWEKLRDSLQDPQITVRRKVVFLFSTLLISTTPKTSHNPALILDDPNNTATLSTTTSPNSPNLHSPSDGPSNETIHANSHAAHLRDPSRTNTSPTVFRALRAHNIIEVVINSIVNPVPYGEDGENMDPDLDYEERALKLLHEYTVTCNGDLSGDQKRKLKEWYDVEEKKFGEAELSVRWNLSVSMLRALVSRVV